MYQDNVLVPQSHSNIVNNKLSNILSLQKLHVRCDMYKHYIHVHVYYLVRIIVISGHICM